MNTSHTRLCCSETPVFPHPVCHPRSGCCLLLCQMWAGIQRGVRLRGTQSSGRSPFKDQPHDEQGGNLQWFAYGAGKALRTEGVKARAHDLRAPSGCRGQDSAASHRAAFRVLPKHFLSTAFTFSSLIHFSIISSLQKMFLPILTVFKVHQKGCITWSNRQ